MVRVELLRAGFQQLKQELVADDAQCVVVNSERDSWPILHVLARVLVHVGTVDGVLELLVARELVVIGVVLVLGAADPSSPPIIFIILIGKCKFLLTFGL